MVIFITGDVLPNALMFCAQRVVLRKICLKMKFCKAEQLAWKPVDFTGQTLIVSNSMYDKVIHHFYHSGSLRRVICTYALSVHIPFGIGLGTMTTFWRERNAPV